MDIERINAGIEILLFLIYIGLPFAVTYVLNRNTVKTVNENIQLPILTRIVIGIFFIVLFFAYLDMLNAITSFGSLVIVGKVISIISMILGAVLLASFIGLLKLRYWSYYTAISCTVLCVFFAFFNWIFFGNELLGYSSSFRFELSALGISAHYKIGSVGGGREWVPLYLLPQVAILFYLVFSNGIRDVFICSSKTMDLGFCLMRGWKTFEKNSFRLIVGTLLIGIAIISIYIAAFLVSLSSLSISFLLEILVSILSFCLLSLLLPGLAVVALKANREEKFEIKDAFKPFTDRPLDYLITGLVMQSGAIADYLITHLVRQSGAITYNICTIATVTIFFFAPFFVAQGADYKTALTTAKDITFAHFGEVFALFTVIYLINFLGIIFFFIGLLVTAPVTFLAIIEAFNQLRNMDSSSPAKPDLSCPSF